LKKRQTRTVWEAPSARRMPTLRLDDIHDVSYERERALDETSDERFDRKAFAMRALDLVRPAGVTVAVCDGARMRVETGRNWRGAPARRWALLAVPPGASRRAIATAVAELTGSPEPYALDVLFA
jgi:hypothetical protein